MQPRNIETVHNYLPPTKILSSLMSSKKKKIDRSLTTQQINHTEALDQSLGGTTPRKQRESYKKRPEYSDIQGQKQSANFIIETQNQIYSSDVQKDKSKGSNDNNNFIKLYDDRIGNSSRVSKASMNSYKKSDGNNIEQFPFNKKEYSEIKNVGAESSKRFALPNKPRSGIEKIAIQQILKQLVEVKNSLQTQIGALKNLLDNTSTTLQQMDQEFEIFKGKILSFTSQALDSAFREYKKHLPNWSVYEEAEQKGLKKLAELSSIISDCENSDKTSPKLGTKQLENTVPEFRRAVEQVKAAGEECYSHRPIISEQKVKKLEDILRQISSF